MSGETHKDRINLNEPEAPPGRPPMPDHFDEVGKKTWETLCNALEVLGIMSTVDVLSLSIYCDCVSGYRHAMDKQEEFGQVLIQNGIPKRNPYMTEVHMHRAEILKLNAQFGLTPVSRSSIVVPGSQKAFDALDELLN